MPVGPVSRSDFWAKLERDDQFQIVRWHRLEDHCADVAACAYALLQTTILRRRLASLAGVEALSDAQVERLCVLIALHDAGKANHDFQDRAFYPKKSGQHLSPIVNAIDELGGGGVADTLLCDALDLMPADEWFLQDEPHVGLEGMLLAVWGHHGRPVQVKPGFSPAQWTANRHREPLKALKALRLSVQRWFPLAFGEDVEALPCPKLFQHGFAGLVSLADWMGSDQCFFPFTTPDGEDRFEWAKAQALKLSSRMGLALEEARGSLEEAVGFAQVSEHVTPRPAQASVGAQPLREDGELMILEAETGSGKTEAALWRYLQLFERGLVDGMYFALPTRAAATQLFERVVKIVARAFGEDNPHRPPVSLAVPGYLRVDGAEGTQLTRFEVRWDEDRTNHARGWSAESPTRFLAGAIVVGTIDQVLLSTLQVKHAHLRASALLRQFLVVDEVHASDAYMSRLLEAVLAFHLGAKGYALLMSATLGSGVKRRLLGAPRLSYDQAREEDYPLVSVVGAARRGAPVSCSAPSEVAADKVVKVELTPWMEDQASLVAAIWAQVELGARVLVIRSTVSACVQLQEALEAYAQERVGARWCGYFLSAGGRCCPHHSRYSPKDRKILDESVSSTLAPDSIQEHGVVVVATQTVEQSLDIDADVLWTDLCPMDVLLQRVGRLHRHRSRDAQRPEGFKAATLYVLTPDGGELSEYVQPNGAAKGPCGLGTVYEDLLILEATSRALRQGTHIKIPAQNRQLVEDSTHQARLDAIVAEHPERWAGHQQQLMGLGYAQSTIAALNVVDRGATYDRSYTDSSERDAKIQTRLGANDRVVFFEPPLMSPLGQDVERLTIPEHMAWGVEDEDCPVVTSANADEICFDLGAVSYRYDRLGLQRIY